MRPDLDRPTEMPRRVGGVVVVWREEDLEPVGHRGLEDPLDVLEGIVFPDAVADQSSDQDDLDGRATGTPCQEAGVSVRTPSRILDEIGTCRGAGDQNAVKQGFHK